MHRLPVHQAVALVCGVAFAGGCAAESCGAFTLLQIPDGAKATGPPPLSARFAISLRQLAARRPVALLLVGTHRHPLWGRLAARNLREFPSIQMGDFEMCRFGSAHRGEMRALAFSVDVRPLVHRGCPASLSVSS